MKGEIARAARADLEEQLGRYGCALILGPRQVGKTTLARQLLAEAEGAAVILDMQRPDDRNQVQDFQTLHGANAGKLIILDEAQEAPELFPQLRAWLDRREIDGDKTRWLLLGSAAAKLTQMAGELGGRYGVVDLWPFQLSEVAVTRPLASTHDAVGDGIALTAAQVPVADSYEIQHRIWLRGGFPKSYLAGDEQTSLEWRSNYLESLIEAAFIPHGTVSRPDLVRPMWEILSINQGEPLLLDKAAQRLRCKVFIIQELLAYLVQTRLVRELRPWFQNEGKRLDKPARYFIRDSGLLHAHWGFDSTEAVRGHQLCGKSYEGFVLESIAARAPKSAKFHFYRNDAKQEIDVIVDFGNDRRWAIEVKSGDETRPEGGFDEAVKEVKPEHAFVISSGPESITSDRKVPVYCLSDALFLFDKP